MEKEQELELKNFKISKNVLELIVGLATSEVEGVAGLSGTIMDSIKDWIGKKQLTKGIKVSVEDNVFIISVHVDLCYEYVISDVAKKIQKNIKSILETMTGTGVRTVDVFINNISFYE